MTLTEILVHSLEAFIVGLILVKLVQVRSLYLRSRPTKTYSTSQNHEASKTKFTYETSMLQVKKDHLCLKDLPLPEVSFSNEQQIEIKTTNTVEEKCVLENYIDDFFTEKSVPIFSESETKKEDDEFITIQKENAEIVRKLQITATSARLAS